MKARLAAIVLSAAASVAGVNVHVTTTGSRDAYALILNGSWRSANKSIEEMGAIHDKVGGDYLWFRRGGGIYLVRDRAVLEQSQALFESLGMLEPEEHAIERRQKAIERKEEALDRERDRLRHEDDECDRNAHGPARERRRKQIEAERRDLESQVRGRETEERAFERRSRQMEKEAENRLWVLIDRWIAEGSAKRLRESEHPSD